MNLHFALKLMTIPTLIGLVFTSGFLTKQSSAAGTSDITTLSINQSCERPSDGEFTSSIRHKKQGITVASAGLISGETAILSFSEAESDAAVELFGCDCPACINALQQLRSQSLLDNGNGSENGNGHCWASLQRRVSPQRMQEVLQTLEMREAE